MVQQCFDGLAEDVVHQQKYAAKMKTVTRTTIVVDWTSARDGAITLRISLRTSLRNSISRAGCDFSRCNAGAGLFGYCYCLGHVLPQSSCCFVLICCPDSEGTGQTGGGARIRTEKFGFGDRQFNR